MPITVSTRPTRLASCRGNQVRCLKRAITAMLQIIIIHIYVPVGKYWTGTGSRYSNCFVKKLFKLRFMAICYFFSGLAL